MKKMRERLVVKKVARWSVIINAVQILLMLGIAITVMLGDGVVNQTIPLILCGEEDVEGNHGATIGRLDEKMLFYLASRGIPEEAARSLLARARIEAVVDLLPEALAEEAHKFMEAHTDEL